MENKSCSNCKYLNKNNVCTQYINIEISDAAMMVVSCSKHERRKKIESNGGKGITCHTWDAFLSSPDVGPGSEGAEQHSPSKKDKFYENYRYL